MGGSLADRGRVGNGTQVLSIFPEPVEGQMGRCQSPWRLTEGQCGKAETPPTRAPRTPPPQLCFAKMERIKATQPRRRRGFTGADRLCGRGLGSPGEGRGVGGSLAGRVCVGQWLSNSEVAAHLRLRSRQHAKRSRLRFGLQKSKWLTKSTKSPY